MRLRVGARDCSNTWPSRWPSRLLSSATIVGPATLERGKRRKSINRAPYDRDSPLRR